MLREESLVTEELYLRPRVIGPLRDLLHRSHLLHDVVRALGSPLNLVLPEQLLGNLQSFRDVYRRRHLTGEVFFAHKANRSPAFPRRLAATSGADAANIDVASLAELQTALGCGFAPARIAVTGPKPPELLWLAARTGVTVHVDGIAELRELARVVGEHRLPRVPVLLRLSGFRSSGTTVASRPSRFGIGADTAEAAIEVVLQHADAVDLVGVGYHLDTIGAAEKAVALEGCLGVVNAAVARGLSPRVVDIGGGFGVSYLADAAQWQAWTTALTQAVLGRRPPLTWGGHAYGLRNDGGTLRGALGLYPAHRPLAGAAYLDELLAYPAPSFGGQPLATVLQEHLLQLWVEPGRALLDQCGAVLARVLEVRPHETGHHVVRLDLNAGDVSLEEHGVMMDPLLIPRPDNGRRTVAAAVENPAPVFLFGNLCLEADLITRRAVYLPRLPQVGDLLAFPNTAGYFMDFSADHALGQPIARTLAAWQVDGRWRWCLDDQYWPIVVDDPHAADSAADADSDADAVRATGVPA